MRGSRLPCREVVVAATQRFSGIEGEASADGLECPVLIRSTFRKVMLRIGNGGSWTDSTQTQAVVRNFRF